jgi:hypothetical protein
LNGAAYWQVYTGGCGSAGTPLTQSASNTIAVSPTSNTTYYIRGEGNGLNLKPTCGCKSVSVNVASPPAISISGDATICPGVTTTLSSSRSGGAGGCSVSWRQSPTGQNTWTLSGHTGNTFDVSPSVSTDYIAVYSCTQGGCQDATSNIVSVTIGDLVPPSITCPGPISQNNDPGRCGSIVNYTVTASDDCQYSLLQTDQTGYSSGSEFPVGSTTLSYEVTDAGGNTANCSFSVQVNDVQDPAISCPANISQANSPGTCGRVISYSAPSGVDNCPGQSTSRTRGLGSGATFPVGTTTESYRVTDAAGNTAACSFTITINDTEQPQITCPPNIFRANDAGNCSALVNYTSPQGTDNCPGQSSSLIGGLGSGSHFPVGNNQETYRVTDAAGNTASCSFFVIVNDTEAPQINCPANIFRANDNGSCSAIVPYSSPLGTDNCSGQSTRQIAGLGSGGSFPVGTTTESYQVTDAANNTANCSFTITVIDTEAPQITCPSNMVQDNDNGNCSAIVTYAAPTGTDNCSGQHTQQSGGLGSGQSFPIGMTTESFTVTDAAGNTANCTFSIEIKDSEAPQITCPKDIVEDNENGNCSAIITYALPSGTDNCPGQITTLSAGKGSNSSFPVGTSTETYTVTDVAGNTASCSFTVTVHDAELPQISCTANIKLPNDPGNCSAVVSYLAPWGTDNCSGATTAMSSGLGSGSAFPVGTTTEGYTVTDASNNTASCSFTITITDDQIPVLSLLGANPLILCEGDVYVEAGATASDNCDPSIGQNIFIDNSAVNSNQAGNYTVSYFVTDAHGNSANYITRTVTVRHTPAQLAPQNCGSCSQIRFDFCEGESHPDLEALLRANTNYEASTSFLWYADNSGSQGSPISLPSLNMNNSNRKFYWVSQIENGCEGLARRVRVRVRKTSLVILDLPAIGCGNAQIDLAAWVSDSRGIASAFSFYENNPALSNSLPVGSVSASNGVVNSGQYALVSLPSSPITYYAVATNNTGCQVTGSDAVAVGAGASLDPVANLTVNSGDLVHVPFTSPDATYIIWVNHSSFNNPYIGLLGSSGMGDLVFTAQNIGSSPQTAMLRAIAYNGNCSGQVRDFYITVNPGTNSRQSAGNSLQLTANRINAHDVKVAWQLNYEFALSHIEIEKQINDGTWAMVHQHGVGTHHDVSLQEGSYLDHSGMGNVTKYRLKLIHVDGRVIWSQEVEVSFDYFDNKRFTLYPNPNTGRFKLRAAGDLEGEWRYKLSDAMGRTILIGKLQGSETGFDISHLPPAHYFLVLTSPEGKQYLERVVKN